MLFYECTAARVYFHETPYTKLRIGGCCRDTRDVPETRKLPSYPSVFSIVHVSQYTATGPL